MKCKWSFLSRQVPIVAPSSPSLTSLLHLPLTALHNHSYLLVDGIHLSKCWIRCTNTERSRSSRCRGLMYLHFLRPCHSSNVTLSQQTDTSCWATSRSTVTTTTSLSSPSIETTRRAASVVVMPGPQSEETRLTLAATATRPSVESTSPIVDDSPTSAIPSATSSDSMRRIDQTRGLTCHSL